jgi:hypothetical protein
MRSKVISVTSINAWMYQYLRDGRQVPITSSQSCLLRTIMCHCPGLKGWQVVCFYTRSRPHLCSPAFCHDKPWPGVPWSRTIPSRLMLGPLGEGMKYLLVLLKTNGCEHLPCSCWFYGVLGWYLITSCLDRHFDIFYRPSVWCKHCRNPGLSLPGKDLEATAAGPDHSSPPAPGWTRLWFIQVALAHPVSRHQDHPTY